MKKKIGRLCVITDANMQGKYSHLEISKFAIRGGAEMIQFRDKNMNTSQLFETAKAMKNLCNDSGVQFIINDRVDIALLVDSDGVHLGNDDITIKDARKLLGSEKIIGGTAHSLKEAVISQNDGADYLGFGHIFETQSKIRDSKPKGLNTLKKVVSAVKIPVLAIGGINSQNLQSVMQCGAHGAAVIAAVSRAENPLEAVKKLKTIIENEY